MVKCLCKLRKLYVEFVLIFCFVFFLFLWKEGVFVCELEIIFLKSIYIYYGFYFVFER